MARQYKKILKKIAPKKKAATTEKKPEKVGKDYVLLAIMTFTIMVMIFGWGNFDNYNRALYVLLSASLAITYAKRHAKLNEVQEMWLDRVGYVTMGVAIILFAAVVYMQYIA